MNNEELKKKVREKYGEIVQENKSCCTPSYSCCDASKSVLVKNISKNIGYNESELESVPENANLGLGCGNPLAFIKLKEGDVVLDLGSGAGFDCFLAANKVGKTGKVIGIDMTTEMISKAKENAKDGKYENVDFRLGEIENLPVDDDSIDMVISNCVINLVPDKIKAFKEAFRVLKTGGILMISDIVLLHNLNESVRNSIDAYIGCVAGALLKDDYINAIKNAGFEDIIVHNLIKFPIDVNYLHPNIINKIKEEGISAKELKNTTESVASIKIEAKKPDLKTPTLLPSQKLQLDIFVPLDMCSCVWDKYMNNIFEIITPYIKYISFNTKNTNSEEARNLNIYENCVVIDGKTKFTSSYVLKEKLPEILKRKGLL